MSAPAALVAPRPLHQTRQAPPRIHLAVIQVLDHRRAKEQEQVFPAPVDVKRDVVQQDGDDGKQHPQPECSG